MKWTRTLTMIWTCAALLGGAFAGDSAWAQGAHPLGWGLNFTNQASPVPTNVMSGASAIAAGYWHSLAVKNGRVWAWGDTANGLTNIPAAAQSGVTNVAGGGGFSLALKNDGTVVVWGAPYVATNAPAGATNGVSQIAAGESHALVLKNGGIIAWGSNTFGQCTVPAALTSGVTAVAGGGYFTVALKNSGVQVFGIEATNELSYGIRNVPAAATSGVTAIAAGMWHALALKDGGVIAWGATDGTNFMFDATVVPDDATNDIVAIAAGDLFSLALKSDGTLVAWGDSYKGQHPVPAYVSTGITAIAAGSGHGLAISPVMPPRFISRSTPDAYKDYAYSGSVTAAGDPAVTYHKGGPIWPAWLTLDPNSGALGGTPAEIGPIYFSIVASNSIGRVTNSYMVNVLIFSGPPVFVTTNPLPSGTVGAAYSLQLVASNSPVFSLVAGEGELPSGLELDAAGLITGVPTLVEARFFTVRATNTFGYEDKAFNLSIQAPAGPPVIVTTSPLPNAVVGQAYSVQILSSNHPFFSLEAGSLPQGLGLTAQGLVTGTPAQVETANFTVLATNLLGSTNRAFALTVEGPPAFITTSPLADGAVGVAYSQAILASGDPVFTLDGGSLPDGLVLATNGVLSGTPSAAGDFNFTVLATNVHGADTRGYDIRIGLVPVFLTASPLPNGTNGAAYSQQISATGEPLFSLVSGSVPGGLTFATNGLLSGTPNTAGSFNFTIQASNSFGWSNRVYDLAIIGLEPPEFTGIRVTNGSVRLTWTNYNPSGSIQVWRATNITVPVVLWSNLGVQVSPWTNTAPTNPSYYQLRLVP